MAAKKAAAKKSTAKKTAVKKTVAKKKPIVTAKAKPSTAKAKVSLKKYSLAQPGNEFQRLVKAFGYSMSGFKLAFISEAAFRLEAILAPIMIIVALVLPIVLTLKALLIAAVLLVLLVELINSAIEATVDRISTTLHPLSKQAKDVGSAAVFLAVVNCLVVWSFVLVESYLYY